MARALRRSSAWPVRMTAPLSTSPRSVPAAIGSGPGGRHARLDAVAGQLLLERLADLRVLVLVLDLVSALLHVLGDAQVVEEVVFGAAPADGHVPCGLRPGVEVLVEPHVGGDEDAAGPPVDALVRLPLAP